MAGQNLDGLRVAIIATKGFEESELTEPRKALREAGASVKVVSPENGQIYGMHHHDKAGSVNVDLLLSEANIEDFDALMLPGGALNADAIRMDEKAREFVRTFDREGKPIAVICHGPWLLASAGILKGRKITSYHTIQDDMRNAGAQWQDSQVLRDRNIVSSRQPSDLPAFNREMINLFAEARVQKAA